ncbi:hypothetical protein RB195_020913 [Necator americanus]|uniref:Beta-lactamase-related domain-containing protein n=1 Tax=Necator americanus TaxID=51031 RepID=A0ABR1CNU3_NECAM
MFAGIATEGKIQPEQQLRKRRRNDYIDGIAVDGFEGVKDVFMKNFTDKLEHDGAALAVYHKGKLVVDLWGGWADRANGRNWTRETITNIFSCTKSVAAICMALKVYNKECDYSDKVIKYWPGFGQNGKHEITIDMILTHRAGLPYFEEEITLDEARDPMRISKLIEEECPKYPPGSKIAYHPITFGWLLDQVFCRIDGQHRSIGDFFRDEVQQKHNTDVYIGSCVEQESRIAKLSPLKGTAFRDRVHDRRIFSMGNILQCRSSSLAGVRRPTPLSESIEMFNNPLVRTFGQPAVNGVASARGLALLHQIFMDGTLVSQEFFKTFRQPQYENFFDHTIGEEESKGHGFVYCRSPTGSWQIGHPSMGGQCIRMDPDNELVISYVTNALKAGLGKHTLTYNNLHTKIYDVLVTKK